MIPAIAGLYLIASLAIGLWAVRRTRNTGDFFVAGRRLGPIVTALAAMASAFSGFVFLGGPGLTYQMGISSIFINLPIGITAALMCWVLGKRLRLLAEIREVFTIPDAIQARFDHPATGGLAVLAVLLGTIGYLGAQILALGRLAEFFFSGTASEQWELALFVGIALLLMVAYSSAGGMVAGVYTDVLQGGLMMLTAAAVFVQCLRVGGGVDRILSDISNSSMFGPNYIEPLGTVSAWTGFGFFVVFSVGTLGQPHVLHKFFMIRDFKSLKWMPIALAGSQVTCLLIWLGIGMTVPALVARGSLPALSSPDMAAPIFIANYLPGLLAALVVTGVLAAIMSTSDTFLNIGAAAVARDLPRILGRPLARELFWSRFAVGGIAVAAAGLALVYDDLVALLGAFAFGTFAAGLVPTLAVGLNWDRVSSTAASLSIGTGLALNVGLELANRWSLTAEVLPGGYIPSALALASSLIVLVLATWIFPRRRPLPKDIALAMEL